MNIWHKNNRKLIWFLVIYPLIAALLLLNLPANGFLYLMLMEVVPIAALVIANPKGFKKILIFSLIFFVPFGICLEYIAVVTNTWTFINPETITIFPQIKLFGYIFLEEFLWYLLLVILYLLFYETFLDKHWFVSNKFPKRMSTLRKIIVVSFGLFLALYVLAPDLLKIPYIYSLMGVILGLIPMLVISITHPKIATKLFFLAVYFTYYNLLSEWVGIGAKYWEFTNPDVLIGYVTLFHYKIAFEEFFFWIIIAAPAIACIYELFADDLK